MVSPLAEVVEAPVSDADEFVVLACDGVWNTLDSQQVVDFVRRRLMRGLPLKTVAEQVHD